MFFARIRRSLRLRGGRGTLGAMRSVAGDRIHSGVRLVASRWWGVRGFDTSGAARRAGRGGFARGVVLTARFDGFGGRFGDILNGWRVAEALGSEFRVYWPDRDLSGIRPARFVFGPAFCDAHLVDTVRLANFTKVSSIRRRDLHRLSRGGLLWFDSVGRRAFVEKFTVATEDVDIPGMMSMSEAFMRIPLSERFDRVREWAQEVPPFDLAIHLRRGDIFDGDFRFGGEYANKALPLPLADRLLRGLESDARVLLVGNDLERVRSRLGAKANVLVPADLACPGDDGADVVDFKDFCLLARSRRIIAGRSVFALVPSHIAGVRLEFPGDAIEAKGAVSDLLWFIRERAVAGGADLEVSLACEYLRCEYNDQLTPAIMTELVEAARAADPSNPVYVLHRAAGLFRSSRDDDARHVLEEAADLGVPELCVRLLRHEFDLEPGVGLSRIWGGFLGELEREALCVASETDAWAAFYAALDSAVHRGLDQARELLEKSSVQLKHPAVASAREVLTLIAWGTGTRGGTLMAPTAGELA